FYRNFEAEEMIECGGAISINTALELEQTVNNLLENEGLLSQKGISAREYIYKNAGASEKIINFIHRENYLS
ncbi:MAG TPA: 3-deoxy-D-manno-octulosonic acid transferase, partial [Ginsengibacter sp.]|nr:3-deoxy-D-manno-octulosonic acid transferase [Ginsengibacter sp.]